MSRRFYVALALVLSVMCGAVLAAVNLSGGTTGTAVEVDTTPKAMRVVLYDAMGGTSASDSAETWRGIYPINVRQSATTGAGAVVWAIWNQNGTKTVIIKRVWLDLFFDGTAAATDMKYEIVKATAVTAFSGGSAPTPLLKRTSVGAAVSATCRVLDTGLTTTGITVQNTIWFFALGRVTQTTTSYTHGPGLFAIDCSAPNEGGIELANQEMFGIRQTVTSVVGDNVVGYAEVSER